MTVEKEVIEGTTLCRITGDLRIWDTADTWRRIHPLLAGDEPVTLDLSAVTACDAAGIQLIWQMLRAIRSGGEKITLARVSDAVLSAMQRAGLDEFELSTLRGEG